MGRETQGRALLWRIRPVDVMAGEHLVACIPLALRKQTRLTIVAKVVQHDV